MAMCSYQILARYDESPLTRNKHIKTLDVIRSKQREALFRIRFQEKCLIMLQHRRSLAKILITNDLDDDECSMAPDEEPDCLVESPAFSEFSSDETSNHQQPDELDWSLANSPSVDWNRFEASSPTWSSSTTCCSSSNTTPTTTVSTQMGELEVPSFFLENPNDEPQGSNSHRRNQRSNNCDQTKVRADFQQLQSAIGSNYGDSSVISRIMCEHWQIYLKVLQSPNHELVSESVCLLSELIADNLIQPQSVLHMLQHGLVFNLRDIIWKSGNQSVDVLRLLISIGRTTPTALPYMIELLKASSVFSDLESRIMENSIEESLVILKFFNELIDMVVSQLETSSHQQAHQTPLIPEILLITGLTQETIQSYGIIGTLNKCISPNLIENIVARCLDCFNMRDERSIEAGLNLLANALKIGHITASHELQQTRVDSNRVSGIKDILNAFHESGLEERLESLNKGLKRLIEVSEFSEHCSQGCDVGPSATRSLDRCQQFFTFYQHYAGLLSASIDFEIKLKPQQ